MAFVFCFLAHRPSSLKLLDYLKAVYIAMLPKLVFIPSGGLFHLYLRYWPQSMLFIIQTSGTSVGFVFVIIL